MWRDEFQTYSIALYSPSFGDLLINMWGFGHPALLYILEWLVTRVTSDPTAIQIMQLCLALGVWIIVYVYSPFSRLEKILLLLSYFLFWEYFVMSRNYVLIALIAFAFIALRERRPRPEFALWLLLGLLANAHAYSAIWSMVLAAGLAMDAVRRRSAPAYVPIAGAVVYLLLLAFAIVMMQPPPWYGLSSPVVQFSIPRLFADAETPVSAFVPLSVATVRQAIAYIAHPDTANIPDFFGANAFGDIIVLIQANSEHPMRLALLFAAPVVACWLLTRNWLLTLEFSLVYIGIVLFENIWNFPGSARHHGVVFLALVAAVWSARSRQTPAVLSRWLFAGILFVNAVVASCRWLPSCGRFRKAMKPLRGSNKTILRTRSLSDPTTHRFPASPATLDGRYIISNAHARVPMEFGTMPGRGMAGSRPRSLPADWRRRWHWPGSVTPFSSAIGR